MSSTLHVGISTPVVTAYEHLYEHVNIADFNKVP